MATKFKEGDWVRDKTNCTVVKLGEHYHEGGIEHWQPKVDDWCWFWQNNSMNVPVLARFVGMYNSYTYQCSLWALNGNAVYDNCEPFIGELPTPYKDK